MKPFRVFIITMGSIFFADALSSLIVYFFRPVPFGTELLIDSLTALVITFPLLHFFVFKPLRHFIADRQLAEIAIKESEEKYRSLVNSTDDSIYLVDSGYRYLFMNKQHLSRLGVPESRILEKHFGEFHSVDETSEFIKRTDAALKTGESAQYEYKSQRDDRYFLQTFSPVKDPEGKPFAVTVVSKNITKRKQMEEELRSLSLTDELTGLFNRRGFLTLAAQHLKITNRQGRGLFMLYADLDGLKEINDTFGHREGDRALAETAYILRDSFRESDIVARIGGDEFVVLPVGSSESSVDIIRGRLNNRIAAFNSVANSGYVLSLSVGVAFYDPASPSTVDELLVHGDKLMYEQKKLKKHRA